MSTQDPTTPEEQPNRDLEAMWESLLASEWSSLAVVPTDHGTRLDRVVAAFRSVSARRPGEDLRLLDTRGATVPDGSRLTDQLSKFGAQGARTVVALDSLMRSLAGIPVLQRCEVVLLVVHAGSIDPEGLTSTIGIIGRDRIIGSVAVPPESPPDDSSRTS